VTPYDFPKVISMLSLALMAASAASSFPAYLIMSRERGNRRQRVFFEDGDYALCRDILAERCRKAAVAVWAYCLMPNHVHLIVAPQSADGRARAVGETPRPYTEFGNARARWTGPLLQGRLASAALDEEHLIATARYTVSGSLPRRHHRA